MDHLKAFRIALAVAEQESLAGAARQLRMSAPSVTRILGDLEAELGVVLFHRTTRAVVLTDTGRAFLSDARRIVSDYEEAMDAVKGAAQSPKGMLRITAPVLFGEHYVQPVLCEFMSAYRDVSVDAVYVDRMVNIVDEGFDVAIRIGELADTSLLATRVGAVRRVVCGCKGYYQANGIPQTPQDLLSHRLIAAKPISPSNDWRFKDREVVRVKPRYFVNTMSGAIAAAKLSWGLARVLSYQIGPELDTGGLKTVLDDYSPEMLPIHIMHSEGRDASAKVRMFVSLLAERLRANPYLNP